MVIGHVLPDKDISLLDAYEKCRSLADPKVCCDYALHMGITWWAPKVRGMGKGRDRVSMVPEPQHRLPSMIPPVLQIAGVYFGLVTISP